MNGREGVLSVAAETITEYPRGIVLVAFAVINWVAAGILAWGTRRSPNIRTLRYTAIRGVAIALFVVIGSVVWWDIRLDFSFIGQDAVEWILFLMLVGLSLPSVWFLWMFFTGKFGNGKEPPPVP